MFARRDSCLASCLILLALLLGAWPVSAAILDLTSEGASGYIGDALFTQGTTGAGTGVIDPFLRLQRNHLESGLNSNGPYQLDEFNPTHAIQVNAFGVTEYNGVQMIRFLLDINEVNSRPLVSLDQLKVFVAPVGTYNTLALLNDHATPIYDMGAGNKIYLDYSLEPGSGWSDMYMYLPYELLRDHRTEYLYLYCQFGATGGDYECEDGFEEWASPGDAAPDAACCLSGQCLVSTESECAAAGGIWHADLMDCSPSLCLPPPPEAACCVGIECVVLTEADCLAQGGEWHADLESCDPNPCLIEMACCLEDGSCVSVYAAEECIAMNGVLYADMTCSTPGFACPLPEGACCLDQDEQCYMETEADCLLAGGVWHSGSDCENLSCPQWRVCCIGNDCYIMTEDGCIDVGGSWHSGLYECDPNPCGEVPTLPQSWGAIKSVYR